MAVNLIARCAELEEQELLLRGQRLTAANYAELILFYIVQQRFVDAKYCHNRATAKHSDAILKEIWELNHELQKSKFGDAIRRCRTLNVGEELAPYIVELKKRLIAVQLQLVSRCYSFIHRNNLTALLGLVDPADGRLIDEAEANEIFDALLNPDKFGWTATDDGAYIEPNGSAPNFTATLASLVDVNGFGPLRQSHDDRAPASSSSGSLRPTDIAELKALVSYSDFFDSRN